jgi:plasmid stabilization system protein ParE
VRSDSAAVSKTWIDGFLKLIASLAEMPERCSLAHENDLFPVELREIHYGSGRRKTHRAVFYIVNGVVMVIAIRHFAQDDLSPDVL